MQILKLYKKIDLFCKYIFNKKKKSFYKSACLSVNLKESIKKTYSANMYLIKKNIL